MMKARWGWSANARLTWHGLMALTILLLPPGAKADDEPGAVQQRLLLSVNYLPGGGASVATIAPGSPALKLNRADDPNGQAFQILVGDVITHVNRVKVTSPESYADGLNSQPGRAMLRIIDGPTGQVADWLCETVAVQQRLGIDLRYLDGGGLKVTAIDPGSPVLSLQRAENPGAPFQLRVGEVITAINDIEVSSPATYARALNRRAGSAVLRIIDSVNGEVADWLCGTIAQVVDNDIPPIRDPEPDRERRRIAWVLLIGLTDDEKIGKNMAVSLDFLERMFQSNVDEDRLQLVPPIRGADCNRDNILRRVRSLNPEEDDTVFVYYLGHGGYDPRVNVPLDDPLAGHFFAGLPGGDMTRRELTEAIQSKPGRLKILFTDTCNTKGSPDFKGRINAQTRLMSIVGLRPLEKLLFMNRGWVDVSASSRDQYSWSHRAVGGWFTWNFFQTIPTGKDWTTFLDQLSERSNDFFLDRRRKMLEHPEDQLQETLEAMRGQTAMIPTIIKNIQRDVAEIDANDRKERTFDDMTLVFTPEN